MQETPIDPLIWTLLEQNSLPQECEPPFLCWCPEHLCRMLPLGEDHHYLHTYNDERYF